jgi:hypothetical protein
MAETDGWAIDSDLCFAPLKELYWNAEWVEWRTPEANWNVYDAVYIAATWDYPQHPLEFMQVLAEIDSSRAVLLNELSLVRWNLSKTYLRELKSAGAEIVPSLWHESFSAAAIETAFDTLVSDRIIVKPTISTNATNTFLLRRPIEKTMLIELEATFQQRPFCVQPFVHNIQSEGEYSLFYFDNKFSHAILKTPKPQDFRVQEEHGSTIIAVEASGALLQAGERALEVLDPAPVYARLDFVRGGNGRFQIMELELIEPSMNLRLNEQAPSRLAAAIDAYFTRQT